MPNFLVIADDHKQDFKICNSAKNYRIHLLKNTPYWLGKIKTGLGIQSNFGILEFMRSKNAKIQKRPPLSENMRNTLIDYFSDDVALLAKLTDRNLAHWLQ